MGSTVLVIYLTEQILWISISAGEIGLKSHSASSTLTDDATSLSAFQSDIEKGVGLESPLKDFL